MTVRPSWTASHQPGPCACSLPSRAADKFSGIAVAVVKACGSYDLADGPSAIEESGGAEGAKLRHLQGLSRG
jgi:hypothetical protein